MANIKNDQQVIHLWKKYAKLKAQDDREGMKSVANDLAAEYYALVIDVAERIAPNLKEVTADECASYGVEGLYEAIDKFDLSKGVQFKTFAPHRIRGAIYDNIRKVDWVPRLVRQRSGLIERLRQKHFKQHGCNPSDEEMAKLMECSSDQFDILAKKSNPVGVVSLHNKPAGNNEDDFEDMMNVQNEKEEQPILQMLRDEMFKKLLGHDFTKLERKIIYLVYYENLTMKEVASNTGFSESRISQMHGEIIRRLKQKIIRNPEYASELEKLLESN